MQCQDKRSKELKNYEETKKKSIEERAYALQEDE